MTYMVRTGRKVVVGGLAAALVIAGLWTAARQWGRPASGPQSSIIAQMDVAKTFESWGALKGASTLIVVGTAGTQRYSMVNLGSGPRGSPWTTTEVRVDRTLRGFAGPFVLVRQLGGYTPDGVQEVVSQFPSLQSGERYLLFLTPSPFPGEFYPVGAFQGVFTVSADGLVNNVSQAASATGVSVHDVPLDQVQESIRTAPALDASP